jgi:tRNA-dihydrouridine synthase 2
MSQLACATGNPHFTTQAKYLNHNWGLTKFCVNQFKGEHITTKKADATHLRQIISRSKDFFGVEEIVGAWTGEEEFAQIVGAIEARPPREHRMHLDPEPTDTQTEADEEGLATPPVRQNPEPPGSGAPLLPSNTRRMQIPPMASGHDATTPTPTPPLVGVPMAVM